MASGYTKQNVFISALHGLVYTHPSMAANLLCPPGSSLSPEFLTSFVLPIHNQGVSFAPLRGHAPWKIFLPTTGSFFVFLITDLLPASALFPADVICYILLCSGTVHLTASYIVSFLILTQPACILPFKISIIFQTVPTVSFMIVVTLQFLS